MLMILMTFYVAPFDTALSPVNSEAVDFDEAEVINIVFIFERWEVSFTPVGTALSPYFLRRNIPPSLLDRVVRRVWLLIPMRPILASTSCWTPSVADDAYDATVFASTSCWSSCVADDVDNVLCYPG